MALAFSEVKCRDDYYRDLHNTDQLVYNTTERHLNSYSNLGFNQSHSS